MDFSYPEQDVALRQEVREFVEANWNSPYESHINSVYSYDVDSQEDEVLFQEFTRKLAAKGWYTMHWPKEHGGQAVPFTTQIAYREEMAYRGAPIAAPNFEAPMLMFHGQPVAKGVLPAKDRQRRTHLMVAGLQRAQCGRGPGKPSDPRRA